MHKKAAWQQACPLYNNSRDRAGADVYHSGMRILHSLSSLALICLATGALWAADDPFVGKWRVNQSKIKITDEMKVVVVGENKYAFTFVPGAVDTIVADGTDQPTPDGTTLSVTVEGANNWKVVRKKDGRKVISSIWTLSADGKTLDDAFTQYQPDGSSTTAHLGYQRTAGSSGFPGTWDSVSSELDASVELAIQPYEGDGLSLISPLVGGTQNIKFDGKTSRRVNRRSLELTNESQGKIRVTLIEVSTDLRTLTINIHLAGDKQPGTILVFDRE